MRQRNQAQIVCVIKCTETSQVTLATHLIHPLLPHGFYTIYVFPAKKTLAELKSSQHPKEVPNLVRKNEVRNFSLGYVSFI